MKWPALGNEWRSETFGCYSYLQSFFSSIHFVSWTHGCIFMLMPFLSFSTFNWSVPFLSGLAITVLCAGATLIYYIPLRYIVLVWGEKSFCFCIVNTPNSRGVRYWKKNSLSIFLGDFSITIIRWYFAECVIVLISEYRAQLQFMIFFIFCVLSSHQWLINLFI